jgi:hypothetical protein
MSICLRRREFVAGLGGAAVWPFAARAQQGDRVRRIGVLNCSNANSASEPFFFVEYVGDYHIHGGPSYLFNSGGGYRITHTTD